MRLIALCALLPLCSAVLKRTTDTILDECSLSPEENTPKQFHGESIGFVTPWHPEGKQAALRYSSKFTYISPMWYHIEPEDVSSDDVKQWKVRVVPASNTPDGKPDAEWARELQSRGVKIVPIFAFYGWRKVALGKFFMHPDAGYAQHSVSRQLIKHCVDVNCDGFVLEWGAVPMNEYYKDLVPWLTRLKGTLSKFIERKTYFMLSVHADPSTFGETQFEHLAPMINKFILHTYNFTGPVMAKGPNAPYQWFLDMLDGWRLRTRTDADDLVLVTLNTFGKEFRDEGKLDVEGYEPSAGALDARGELTRWDVTGKQFENLLKVSKKNDLKVYHRYDNQYQEHYTQFSHNGDPRTIYYPSKENMKKRIDVLDKSRATGVGFWNLGTGMDQFFGLL